MRHETDPTTHPEAQARRAGLAAGAAFVAVSAFGGAAGLATEAVSLGDEIDRRLPFASRRFSGAALAAIIGVPFSALSALAWRGDRRTGSASIGAGTILMAWIAVQLAVIRHFSFFHPLFAVIGGLFVVAGRPQLGAREASERRRFHRPCPPCRAVSPKSYSGPTNKVRGTSSRRRQMRENANGRTIT
ncbi:MAG: hypothetical protein WAX12_16910 [Candidatus Microthrix subdominans]